MKRTLLAIGFAVLVSMLFAPYEKYWHSLGHVFFVSYVPDWCRAWYWFPIFWRDEGNRILWAFGQTAFVAVLAAVLVNFRRQRAS